MTNGKINVSKEQVIQQPPNNSQHERKHKIMIVGDSHTRGSASSIKHNLNNDFDLNGFVKPGAGITTLTSSVTEDTKHLTLKDILVFWGGAIDVSRNNSQVGLKSLTKLVEANSNTNIILLCVPYRHDIPDWSCVNIATATFNRKLKKLMKPHKHVTVLGTDLDRKVFTRQGRHMNNLGKERIALDLANEASKILLKQGKVISLEWKNIQVNSTSEGTTEDNIPQQEDPKWENDTMTKNQDPVTPIDNEQTEAAKHSETTDSRTSVRKRKQPVTRRSDFLWTANSRPRTERLQQAAMV